MPRVPDVAERRARALDQVSEHSYQLLFDQSPLPMWVYDVETLSFLAVNEAAIRLYGYSRGEFLSMTILDVRPPEEVDRLLAHLATMPAGGSAMGAWRHRRKDGMLLDLETAAHGIVLGGRAARLVVLNDVTERLRTQEALQRAHEQYRDLFENAVFGIFRSTPDGRVTAVNAAAARIYGYESPEELRAAVTDIPRQVYVDPARRAELLELLAQRGSASSLEAQALRKDGSVIWVSFIARALRDSGGAVVAYEGMVEDITERKRAEELLRARARQQAVVAELGQRALSGLELSALMDEAATEVAKTLGVECSGVLELLPGAEEVSVRAGVGWRDGVVGRTLRIESRSHASYTLASIGPVLIEDLAHETRFTPPAILLEHGFVSGISVPMLWQGAPLGLVGAHTTRRRSFGEDDANFLQAVANLVGSAMLRKRAEDTLVHLVERVISAQDNERRYISRELHDETGQSLTTLLLGLRAIEDARTIAGAKAAARRLRKVARRTVEDVGRLARGLHPSILDDMGLPAAVVRLAREYAEAWGFEAHVRTRGLTSQRLPIPVERTLYRIMQEALTNAARHGHPERVDVALKRKGGLAELTVIDDGSGFDASRVRTADPSHLGLHGMRERATLLGGSFEVDSRPGEGTTIRVRIPIPAAAPSKRKTRRQGTARKKRRPPPP